MFVCMHVDVCWRHLEVWGELASHINPPPQLSRLGIQVSLAIYMFVCLGYGWVGYFTFLFFLISLR